MYDAIVVGVGGMGSAALYHLARRGARVLGIEQFGVPNEMGSSHGHTRIIRFAYWEDSKYVPLLFRARELWLELDARLFVRTGCIDAGDTVPAVLRVCAEFNLPIEHFDARRFPGYALPSDLPAVYQPDGGFLLSERCIVAHADRARALGAEIHTGEGVLDWDADGTVRTDRDTYKARHLIFTAGAWTGKLLTDLGAVLSPERQVVLWTRPLNPDLFRPDTFPVFYIHVTEGGFYGFPDYENAGFKIGKYHHRQQQVDPDTMDRQCSIEDEGVLRAAVRRYFPMADGPTVMMKPCLFTNTRDEHFVIERLGDNVTVAAGFSGHGFKFCSVVGEILAELSLDGGTRHDISLFGLGRLRQ